MKKPITVRILISVPDPARFDACTLVFETLRTGFPTARIVVDMNQNMSADDANRVFQLCLKHGVECRGRYHAPIHHAEWIQSCIFAHEDGPLVLLDGDTVFWKSVEDWEFPEGKLLAGYYVPRMWNDFAKCISFARIHTSLMWFPDVPALRQVLKAAYPYAHEATGEYCPCDPFMPAVRFIEGTPYFWDSCSNLFNMLGGRYCEPFRAEHKACFDHLNSASFYNVMMERLDDNRGFHIAHTEWVKDPARLKNIWPIVDSYYRQKELEGQIKCPTLSL